MNPVVKLLHIVQWAAIILLMLPFMALGGFIVIPLALLFKIDMKELWLWGNREEGYPARFDRYVQDFWYKKIFPQWWWYTVRNPLNNMRFMFDDDAPFDIDGWEPQSMEAHDLIIADIESTSRWSYRGAMAGYRRVWLTVQKKDKLLLIKSLFKLRRVYRSAGIYYGEFWIGWKVGSIVPGLGFATQLRLKREIGT